MRLAAGVGGVVRVDQRLAGLGQVRVRVVAGRVARVAEVRGAGAVAGEVVPEQARVARGGPEHVVRVVRRVDKVHRVAALGRGQQARGREALEELEEPLVPVLTGGVGRAAPL